MISIDDAVQSAISSIRAGNGPRLLVAKTYRLSGHTASDPDNYRLRSEVEKAWESDPIANLGGVLRRAKVDALILDKHESNARIEMAAVFSGAKAASWPPLSRAFEDVQDIGDPRQEAF